MCLSKWSVSGIRYPVFILLTDYKLRGVGFMVKICIVDDHRSIWDSYKAAMEKNEGFVVTGFLPGAFLADVWCRQNSPDLVLMDVCTEGGESGLEATRRIKERMPQIKVIVMTGFDEISYVTRAKEAGADGFVYKAESFDELKNVIDAVLAGEKVFPEPRKITMPIGNTPLSERETEVLRLLCQNKSRTEIAEELSLSEHTVKRHIQNMLDKTGFSSVVALAVYMVSNGWINPNY